MLLCQCCMDDKHFKCHIISYQNPKCISMIVKEIARILERIINNCNQLGESDDVDFIHQQVKQYQNKAAELEKKVIGVIESDPKAYRAVSVDLYNQVFEFKREVFDSKMYHIFKDSFTFHQLTQRHGYPDKLKIANQDEMTKSSLKTSQDQSHQLLSAKDASLLLDMIMDGSIEQVKHLKKDVDKVNSLIIQLATHLSSLAKSNQKSSPQTNSIFSTDSKAVVNRLDKLSESSLQKPCNFDVINK